MAGIDDPPLRPGTAIATFGVNGKYGGDGVQHAAVFDGYGTENGRNGMYIVEQAATMNARKRFVPFGTTGGNPRYRAETYSVIK
jgi:hypothetical protein